MASVDDNSLQRCGIVDFLLKILPCVLQLCGVTYVNALPVKLLLRSNIVLRSLS